MAKKRFINTKFWTDNYIGKLDPIERYLFIYFLTNPHTDICGVYELPLKIAAVETGLEMEMVFKILKRFRRDKKIYYFDGWIFVKNFIRHQIINESVKQGIKRSADELPMWLFTQIKQVLSTFPEIDNNENTDGGQSGNRVGTNATLLNLTKPNLTKPISKSKDLRPDIEIIRLFASKKEMQELTKEQEQSFIKRNLRTAQLLKGYPIEKIEQVMDWLKENADFKWTLESVGKFIDEDLTKISFKKKTLKL